MQWKYELYNKEKIDCPICGKLKTYQRYITSETGNFLENKYGRCDKENSCGYWLKPENNYALDKNVILKYVVPEKNLFDADSIDNMVYDNYHLNKKHKPNTFMSCIINYFGQDKALEAYLKYRLGTFHDSAIIYPYIFMNNVKSGKIMWYNDDMHRDKNKNAQWLHNFNYTDSNDILYVNSSVKTI